MAQANPTMMDSVRSFAANITGQGAKSASGQQQPQDRQSGQQSGQNRQSVDNDPNRQTEEQQRQQMESDPMAVYKDIFAVPDPSKAEKAPSFELPGEAINKAAEQLNFSSSIPEELRSAFEGMGEQGKAILAALDHVGRQSYATSMSHLSNLTGKFVDTRSQFDRKGLGRSINEHLALNSVSSLAGEKSSPVVKEGLKMIGKNLSAQYPDASPEWIAQKSREFYMEMAKATSPDQFNKDNAAEASKAPGGIDFDWSTFAEGAQNPAQ